MEVGENIPDKGGTDNNLRSDSAEYSYSTSPYNNNNNNPYKLITRRIDATKVRNAKKRDLEVETSLTQDVKISQETHVRAGAVVYTKKDGVTYFCLGVDTQSGNLTDFGGGVKKEEDVIVGGLRELEEESLGVFGHITPDMISKTVSFYSYNMIITFIPVKVDIERVTKEFNKRLIEKEDPEVCGITWMSTEEFMESIHGRGRKLYIRVRKLLAKVTSTIKNL